MTTSAPTGGGPPEDPASSVRPGQPSDPPGSPVDPHDPAAPYWPAQPYAGPPVSAPPGGPPPGYWPPTYGEAPAPPFPQAPAATSSRRRRRMVLIGVVVAAGVAVAVTSVVVATHSSDHAASAGVTLSPSVADTATGGVVFTSEQGRFRARFPAAPTEQHVPATIGGVTLTVHVAVTQDPVAEVASEMVSADLPRDQYQTTMRAGLASFAAPGNLTVADEQETTFRGQPARSATLNRPNGGRISAMIFIYSPSRVYIIVAEQGATADRLVASFVALP